VGPYKESEKEMPKVTSIKGRPFFCSWSGGKDSCLALYHAIQNKGAPKALLTMMTEDGRRSRSHGMPIAVIQHQAKALGIPLIMCGAAWNDYEERFVSAIGELKGKGIECGVFGDIDLDPHLEWVERVCASVKIRPYEPLWKRQRRDLLNEFLDLGFKATVISIKQGVLDERFLGRTLDRQVIADMEKCGIDASGEMGEYHTVVTNGPIFSFEIYLKAKDVVVHDGYCFLDVSVDEP
jgi:diphthine-ammonia ligase